MTESPSPFEQTIAFLSEAFRQTEPACLRFFRTRREHLWADDIRLMPVFDEARALAGDVTLFRAALEEVVRRFDLPVREITERQSLAEQMGRHGP